MLLVGLPVRTALLQNKDIDSEYKAAVGLPVRTALLQNREFRSPDPVELDYQSERHCSKTNRI